jgi:callose synthase
MGFAFGKWRCLGMCMLQGSTYLADLFVNYILQIAQAIKPAIKFGLWGSIKALARGYEIIMGLLLFTPIAFLAWFPFVSEFQTRMLFNQAFSRGLQISRILGGHKKDRAARNKE